MSKKLEEIAADAAAEWIKNSTANHSLANACALYGYNAGFLAGYKAAQEHAHAALEEAEARIQELRDRLMEESGGRLKLFKDDADAKAAYQEALEDPDSCKRVPDYDDEMRKYIKTRGKKGAFW